MNSVAAARQAPPAAGPVGTYFKLIRHNALQLAAGMRLD